MGGRRGGRRAPPAREGPLAGHRHDRLARRGGHGPVRGLGVAPERRPPAPYAEVLQTRRPEHPRRPTTPPLGCRLGPTGREPHLLRLRPHARGLAHPPLHRLDGRRRVALEARLPVPCVQLRRRHPLDERHDRPQVPRRRGPTRRRSGDPRRQPARQRSPHPATPRSCCRPTSTARCGSPRCRVAPPTARRRSTLSPSASLAAAASEPRRADDSLDRAVTSTEATGRRSACVGEPRGSRLRSPATVDLRCGDA